MEEDQEQTSDSPLQFSWKEGLRFRAPHRLFHKKFANTSRFVVSGKVWLHTIPTRDCDILLTFPAKTSDEMLMWVLSRLRTRAPELAVHVRHHSHTGVYGFYLTASYDSLLRGAEELAIRKTVKKDLGGGFKEFIYEDQDYFEGVEDATTFLSSQERQSIVQHMLFNVRATDEDRVGKFVFHEGQPLIPILISRNVIQQILPLHNTEDMVYLRKNWVSAFFKSQPLDKIFNYFGVKIAMYFTYLGHYTKALTLPAFLGLIIWLIDNKNQAVDDIMFVLFALFNVVWSTLYLEHWKRSSAEYAYHWGTLDREDELLKEPRPLYRGPLKKSPVTGRLEPEYPAWKRNVFRYCVSIPVICMCLGVVIANMLIIFKFQDYINRLIKSKDLPFFFKFIPKIMLALTIGILDDIYKKIAQWLNDRENYRLDDIYENHLIIKLVLFQFVNSFLSLFYIAFYLQDMDRLKEQLAALLITRQVVGNIKEALLPYCVEKIKLYRIGYQMTEGMSPDTLERHMREMTGNGEEVTHSNGEDQTSGSDLEAKDAIKMTIHKYTEDGKDIGEEVFDVSKSGPQLTQAEVEAAMKKYEDTYEDYLEMFIQFGYVTLFSSAFPMAAMCALLNNVIEIRSDAFKLCFTFQRPFSQAVESIGIWQDALELMSVIAVMVNCALIGFSELSDRLFPGMATSERIVLIVILEHIILMLKMMLAYAIPDQPQWVAEEKARLEFLRREALKKLEGGTPAVEPMPVNDTDWVSDLPQATSKPHASSRHQSPARKSPSPARVLPGSRRNSQRTETDTGFQARRITQRHDSESEARRGSQRPDMTAPELEELRAEILRAKERTPTRGDMELRQRRSTKTDTSHSSSSSTSERSTPSSPADRTSPPRQAQYIVSDTPRDGQKIVADISKETPLGTNDYDSEPFPTDRISPPKELNAADRISPAKEPIAISSISPSKEPFTAGGISPPKEPIRTDRIASSKEAITAARISPPKEPIITSRISPSKELKATDRISPPRETPIIAAESRFLPQRTSLIGTESLSPSREALLKTSKFELFSANSPESICTIPADRFATEVDSNLSTSPDRYSFTCVTGSRISPPKDVDRFTPSEVQGDDTHVTKSERYTPPSDRIMPADKFTLRKATPPRPPAGYSLSQEKSAENDSILDS